MSSMVMSMWVSWAPVRAGTWRSMIARTRLDERVDRWSVGDDEADCDAEAPGVGGLVGNGAGGGEDDAGDCEGDALDHAAHEGVADAGFSAGVAEEDGVGGVSGEDADARHDLCGEGWRDGHGLDGERVDVFPGVAQAAQRRLAVGTVGLVGGVGCGFVVGDLGNQLVDLSAAWQSPRVRVHRHPVVCWITASRARWMRPLMAGTVVLSASATWS